MSDTGTVSGPGRARWELLVLALLAMVFCFAKLDSGSLRTWDEAIYAQVNFNIVNVLC